MTQSCSQQLKPLLANVIGKINLVNSSCSRGCRVPRADECLCIYFFSFFVSWTVTWSWCPVNCNNSKKSSYLAELFLLNPVLFLLQKISPCTGNKVKMFSLNSDKIFLFFLFFWLVCNLCSISNLISTYLVFYFFSITSCSWPNWCLLILGFTTDISWSWRAVNIMGLATSDLS